MPGVWGLGRLSSLGTRKTGYEQGSKSDLDKIETTSVWLRLAQKFMEPFVPRGNPGEFEEGQRYAEYAAVNKALEERSDSEDSEVSTQAAAVSDGTRTPPAIEEPKESTGRSFAITEQEASAVETGEASARGGFEVEHQQLLANMKADEQRFAKGIEATQRLSGLQAVAHFPDDLLSESEKAEKLDLIQANAEASKTQEKFEAQQLAWTKFKDLIYDRAKKEYDALLERYYGVEEEAKALQEELSKLSNELLLAEASASETRTVEQANREALLGNEAIRKIQIQIDSAKAKLSEKNIAAEKDRITQNRLNLLSLKASGIDREDNISEDPFANTSEPEIKYGAEETEFIPYIEAASSLPQALLLSAKVHVKGLISEHEIAEDSPASLKKFTENAALLAAKLTSLILKTEPDNEEFSKIAGKLLRKYLIQPSEKMRPGEAGGISRARKYGSKPADLKAVRTSITEIQLPQAIIDLVRTQEDIKEGIKAFFGQRWPSAGLMIPAPKSAQLVPIQLREATQKIDKFNAGESRTDVEARKIALETYWKQRIPQTVKGSELAVLSSMAEEGHLNPAYFNRFGEHAKEMARLVYEHVVYTQRLRKNESEHGIVFFKQAASIDDLLSVSPGDSESKQIETLIRAMRAMSKPMSEGGLGGSPISREQCKLFREMRNNGIYHGATGVGKSKAIGLYGQIYADGRIVLHVSPFKIKDSSPNVKNITVDELRKRITVGDRFENQLLVFDEYDGMIYAGYRDEHGAWVNEPLQKIVREKLGRSYFQMSATRNLAELHSVLVRNRHKKQLLLKKRQELRLATEPSQEEISATMARYPQGEKGLQERIKGGETELQNDLHILQFNRYTKQIEKTDEELKKTTLMKQQRLSRLPENTTKFVSNEGVFSSSKSFALRESKRSVLILFPEERNAADLAAAFEANLGTPDNHTAIAYLDDGDGEEKYRIYRDGAWIDMGAKAFDQYAQESNPKTYILYTANCRGGDFRTHSREKVSHIILSAPTQIPPADELAQWIGRDRSNNAQVTHCYTATVMSRASYVESVEEIQKPFNEIAIQERMTFKATQSMKAAFEEVLGQLPQGHQVDIRNDWEGEFARAKGAVIGQSKTKKPVKMERWDDPAEIARKGEAAEAFIAANPNLMAFAKDIGISKSSLEKNDLEKPFLKNYRGTTAEEALNVPSALPGASERTSAKYTADGLVELGKTLKVAAPKKSYQTSEKIALGNYFLRLAKAAQDAKEEYEQKIGGRAVRIQALRPPAITERFEYYQQELKKMGVDNHESFP